MWLSRGHWISNIQEFYMTITIINNKKTTNSHVKYKGNTLHLRYVYMDLSFLVPKGYELGCPYTITLGFKQHPDAVFNPLTGWKKAKMPWVLVPMQPISACPPLWPTTSNCNQRWRRQPTTAAITTDSEKNKKNKNNTGNKNQNYKQVQNYSIRK